MQLLNQLSIKTKLIVMLLVVSLCAMLASTLICSSAGKSILTQKVFNQLTSLRAAKTYKKSSASGKLIGFSHYM